MFTKLKAGKYYIGDPGYLFDASWNKILKDTNFFEKFPQQINGIPIAVGSTAYGDGLYTDDSDRNYTVDAGLIGVLPIELIKIDNKLSIEEIDASENKHIVNFDTDFNVEISNGKFVFGNIFIDTNGVDYEEDEDDYSFYEDEEENEFG